MSRELAFVIEDDVDSAILLRNILNIVGIAVKTYQDGRTALESLKYEEPTLVLLDLNLPGSVSGLDILEYIKREERFENTKVLVISGHSELIADVQELADFIMLKPINVSQLEQFVKRLADPMMLTFHAASTEPLTGLYNLPYLTKEIEHAIVRYQRNTNFRFAVVEFSINDYEEIVGQVGLAGEEHLLITIAAGLTNHLRKIDTICRVKDGVFLALLEDIRREEDIKTVFKRKLSIMEKTYQIDGKDVPVTLSIGAVHCDPANTTPEDYLTRAHKDLS